MFWLNLQSYNRTEKIIRENFETEIELIKNNVFNSLENVLAAYSISEILLNQEMEDLSQILLDEYEKNQSPENWDLKQLKSQMPDYDIYIINDQLKIINTTLAADLGLDFSKYSDFSKLLYSRLKNKKFVADRLDLAQNTGLITKFSYQPSPDSKYLFELGIDISKRFAILRDFNLFKMSDDLIQRYEQLQNINIYKYSQKSNKVGLLKSSNPDELEAVSPTAKAMVIETYTENKMQKNSFVEENYQITDFYLPFLVSDEESDSEWWNSFVIRVRYDDQTLVEQLKQERKNILLKLFILFITFIIFSLVIHYLIKNTKAIAFHDCLTGLPNRKAFEEYFHNQKKKNKNYQMAVLYLDLDGFKGINDNYGHETGDKLLKIAAQRLKSSLRADDKISRIGGDEFTILLTEIKSEKDVEMIINKLKNRIAEPYQIDGQEVSISCSIGYSMDDQKEKSFKELLNQADTAMYLVKNEKNQN
jgi:diguanylate cyclase (GGDEF)-like protein